MLSLGTSLVDALQGLLFFGLEHSDASVELLDFIFLLLTKLPGFNN